MTLLGRSLTFVILAFLSLPLEAKAPHSHTPSPPVDFAYIYNSGTATLLGYRIYVGANGRIASVTLYRNGRTTGGRHATLTPAVTHRFFADLAAAGGVDTLPSSDSGPTDAAHDVRVYVRYHGLQSPNLRISSTNAGATLYQDTKQIAQVLRLPVPDNP